MLKIKAAELNGFLPGEVDLYTEVLRISELVLNSEEFKELVLNFKYRSVPHWYSGSQKIYPNFYYTDDTNDEVYRTLQAAFDDHLGNDNIITVRATAYYKDNNIVGSASVGPGAKNYIKLNKKFFGPIPSMVKTFIHEYSHRIGYGHSYLNTSLRKYSVPYATGHIGEDLASMIVVHGKTLTPVQQQSFVSSLFA